MSPLHFNFDKHICSSSYFHIRALCHIRPLLDPETPKTIACAIVGSRLNYVNSILTSISSHNIHRLQCVKNSLARVVTHSTSNTTSALNSLHWLPMQQRINFKLATHSCPTFIPQYLSSLLHPYMLSRQLRSASFNLLSQLCINIALASHGPSLWNSLPHHLTSTDSYTVFKSILKTQLFSGVCISGT